MSLSIFKQSYQCSLTKDDYKDEASRYFRARLQFNMLLQGLGKKYLAISLLFLVFTVI
jgi:hypothetical protein